MALSRLALRHDTKHIRYWIQGDDRVRKRVEKKIALVFVRYLRIVYTSIAYSKYMAYNVCMFVWSARRWWLWLPFISAIHIWQRYALNYNQCEWSRLLSLVSFSLFQYSSADLRFIIHINDARICVYVVVAYLGIVHHKISSYLLNVLWIQYFFFLYMLCL